MAHASDGSHKARRHVWGGFPNAKRTKSHMARATEGSHRTWVAGAGAVSLAGALERKYLSASREWSWQWVFPATRPYSDSVTSEGRRHRLHETVIQRAVREAAIATGIGGLGRTQPPRPLIAIASLRGESVLSDTRPRPGSQPASVSTRDHGHWELKSVDECAAPSAGRMLFFAG
jgi:hypothetical protein